MRNYKPSPWASEVAKVCNAQENPLFVQARLHWSTPTLWKKDDRIPSFETNEPFLYALIWNHGKSSSKNHIKYIGLTTSPKTRFGNHETAKGIVQQRGQTHFSYAPIDFISGKNKIDRVGKALEEIEHLLIWALPNELHNQRKQYTLPGNGKNRGNAWHIFNTGYRFSGRMPREIVFPWMLVKPGRDRTKKA